MSAPRPASLAYPQTTGRRPAANEELASRLRLAATRLNRTLRQQALAGLSPGSGLGSRPRQPAGESHLRRAGGSRCSRRRWPIGDLLGERRPGGQADRRCRPAGGPGEDHCRGSPEPPADPDPQQRPSPTAGVRALPDAQQKRGVRFFTTSDQRHRRRDRCSPRKPC